MGSPRPTAGLPTGSFSWVRSLDQSVSDFPEERPAIVWPRRSVVTAAVQWPCHGLNSRIGLRGRTGAAHRPNAESRRDVRHAALVGEIRLPELIKRDRGITIGGMSEADIPPILNPAQRRCVLECEFRSRFGRDATVAVRAPGRVDLMGSHTDYNEGFVLTMAIDRDTWLLAAPRDDAVIRIHSLNLDRPVEFAYSVDESAERVGGWGAYVQGVAWAIARTTGVSVGFDGLVHGTIPVGSGLSSSASLEVAVATALERLSNLRLDPLAKSQLCQTAENEWVGVNCGILDQYSSVMGREGQAMVLDCRKLKHEFAPIPHELVPVVCDTRAPRQLTGSEYGQRRADCERAAARIATRFAGVRALRDVELDMLEACRDLLTEREFARATFVVQENRRVLSMAQSLENDDRQTIGRLMTESFVGARERYQICVDPMQAMFDAATSIDGCTGCRQAGAGFGGCLIALVERDAVDVFRRTVVERYQRLSGLEPEVYPVVPSDGAGELGMG